MDIPKVFLPLAMDAKGQTHFKKMVNGKFFLGTDAIK
jgi:hypothetical protein